MAYFKYESTKRINLVTDSPGVSLWQRSYYDHIIRNDKSLDRIREYIVANPQQWWFDREKEQRKGIDPFEGWLAQEGQENVRQGRCPVARNQGRGNPAPTVGTNDDW